MRLTEEQAWDRWVRVANISTAYVLNQNCHPCVKGVWIYYFEFSRKVFPQLSSLLKANSITKCFKIHSSFFFSFFFNASCGMTHCVLWDIPSGCVLCIFVPEAAYLLVLWLVRKSPNYKGLVPLIS